MGLVLVLLFFSVPILEIVVLAAAAEHIGWWATAALVLATALLGARLVSAQGRGVLAAARREIEMGAVPGAQLAHGAMIIVAGALLLTPGFITDGIGFALLVPGLREVLRLWAKRRFGSGVIDL